MGWVMLTRFIDCYFVSSKNKGEFQFTISRDTRTARRKQSTAHTLEKQCWRGSGGQSGLKVIVTVTLTGLNAGYLVGKIVPFESRFHKIPALYKENSTLHIPQKNNGREGQGV